MIYADNRGGIEGLPLQLMITILVATLGTAIILGWMAGIESPHYIGEIETDKAIVEQDGSLEITILDQDGNPLADVAVVLSGCGCTAYGTTGKDGKIAFGDLSCTRSGKLTIDASHSDYGEKRATVIVV